ncbi:hypothetical protein [Streptomyces flavofungini]|uniref:hypothetical protein n=1 Tax=Streptomyces flavofungini TaxID=68200 RepID=UPI0034DE00D0
MRVRATAATAALLLAALTACGGGDGGDTADAKASGGKKSAAAEKPDCMAEDISQADWMKYCSDEGVDGGAGGEGAGARPTDLRFGESFSWPDGLEVSVTEAKVFTDYDTGLMESAKPGETDFRVRLKVTNGGKSPVALDDLSLIVEGATRGGEAASTSFEKGAEPLEGRLAPGVSATKTDDNVLKTKYGKKVVVTVQRSSEDLDLDFPEFAGSITG